MSKDSKFEEGKPADPTKNMSPEEAEEWKRMNEKYKEKFKKERESALRDDLIRLAYNKPELRGALLPILKEAADTFECPNCGTKVLEQTGYCVKCKKKVKKAGGLENLPPALREQAEKKQEEAKKKKDKDDDKKDD